jgi:hypothetical protein
MPRKSFLSKPAPAPATLLTDQVSFDAPAIPGPEPTEAGSAMQTVPNVGPTFRVGDYEVGDGYFSELSGHPDILY